MTPADWQTLMETTGKNKSQLAAWLGISYVVLLGYINGTRKTKKTVALAVAARLNGLKPYGGKGND